jgi:hypothetical protein
MTKHRSDSIYVTKELTLPADLWRFLEGAAKIDLPDGRAYELQTDGLIVLAVSSLQQRGIDESLIDLAQQ